MTTTEYMIYDYLKQNCVGMSHAIPMRELGELYNMSGREIRQAIENIKRFKLGYTVIGSTDDGWFIPLSHEREIATAKYKQTAMSMIESQVANDPQTLNDFYILLNQLRDKYPAPCQNQTQATFDNQPRKDVNYVGDKYLGGLFGVEE